MSVAATIPVDSLDIEPAEPVFSDEAVEALAALLVACALDESSQETEA